MRAVLAVGGAPFVTEVDEPVPGPGEVLIDVVAAGVNRADLLQVQGDYPVPTGASPVLGLEVSGHRRDTGEECVALLVGGGYAEVVAVPESQVMPVPAGVGLIEAAALPEVACTVHSNLGLHARLAPGESVLVHGGTGGIGSFALQYAHALGATVFTTVGSAEKALAAHALGADVVVNHREEPFLDVVLRKTDGRGVDVILDVIGARYLADNIAALADSGRLVVIGLQGGRKAELDLNALMRKRGSIIGTTLRSRPVEDRDSVIGKASVCAATVADVWPLIASGEIRMPIAATLPLASVSAAHKAMDMGTHVGKILLTL